MMLLEREDDLRVLDAAMARVVSAKGGIALISGEAGIGKSSLVATFVSTKTSTARVLRGSCDSLFTPSPLAPFYEIARQAGGNLLNKLDDQTRRASIFSEMLELLCDSQPTLLVIEDIHWADEATFDLIKYIGRRIAQTNTLLVLTFRDNEVDAQHPLQLLLGDFAGLNPVSRLELCQLSLAAVKTLIGSNRMDPCEVHQKTSGNPFFVTEILANTSSGIPRTIKDAVLARLSKLESSARNVVEIAAVVGSRMDYGVLESLVGRNSQSISYALRTGMLETTGNRIAFRHELIRDAILADLDPQRARALSQRVLDVFVATGAPRGDLAYLTHLAQRAGNADAVLKFGPAAAKAAASAGAHRIAAAQYLGALEFSTHRSPVERAKLSQAYAEQCAIVDNLEEAIKAGREAIELWREAGDTLKHGENLAALAWPLVRAGQNAAANETGSLAINVLQSVPASPQLATAYRMRAHLHMLDREKGLAIYWGKKAIKLAARFQDQATVAAAELVVGSAMLVAGDENGIAHFDRCLILARDNGLDDLVGLAYLNMGSSYGEQYQFAKAVPILSEGISYAGQCDLDHSNNYMSAWIALIRLYQGRWNEACDVASDVVNCAYVSAVSKIMALVALGRVRARRGDPGAYTALDEALNLALQTNTLQRLAPVREARAEAAWLAGDLDRVRLEAKAVCELAVSHRHSWHAGELCYWRRLAGDAVETPSWSAQPFLLETRGNWREAAQLWQLHGCPYEQARALSHGDVEAQIQALEAFDELGAAPAAAILREQMRKAGRKRIPRGPRASTRQNLFGLTVREMQVLECVADGLSNRIIGARLHVSPKTVDHHVSSTLAKLAASSRAEAARIARQHGLLAQK